MGSTPEMVDSVNAFILVDRSVTIVDIFEQVWISLGTAQKIVNDDCAFSKVSSHRVSWGQCKNSEKHQSVWLGTVATSSLESRSRPTHLWFPFVWPPHRISVWN